MTVDRQVGAVTSSDSQMTLEEWLALRKEAGLQIDPETAEVTWDWGPIGDPYEIYPPDREDNIGRRYFARSPGSDIWVSFYDLPNATRDALWRMPVWKQPDDDDIFFYEVGRPAALRS
jgi:hypothetical protein